MTKALKYSILFLERSINKSKPLVREKVKEIADMYKERKISNFTTATNRIDKLNTITPKSEKRIFKQYDKLVAKYEKNEPLNVRMQKAKEAKKEAQKQAGAVLKIPGAHRRKLKGKKTYQLDVLLFSDKKLFANQKPHKGLYIIGVKKGKTVGANTETKFEPWQFEVSAPSPFPEDLVRVLVNKKDKQQKHLWARGFNILRTSEEFLKLLEQKPGYVIAFKFLSYEALGDGGKEYESLKEGLKDATRVSCDFRYIHTPIDLNSETFMKSIENKRYKQNECWINSITDFYGDTLTNTERN